MTGLPDAQPQHAIIMSRFAMDCLCKMHVVVRELSTSLGPDTADLSMKFGLHSGPVTAGVLRYENHAAYMECPLLQHVHHLQHLLTSPFTVEGVKNLVSNCLVTP